jgi:aminoglycoside phosphotransferase (APT) family kinase protein
MHEDEVVITDATVRRLVDSQFPQWRDLPLRRLPPVGTDNQLFRLGDELLVRLPRIHWAADSPAREHAWLPRLAPHLPLPIPAPVALGEPDGEYPHAWSVVPWLAGDTVTGRHLGGPDNVDWESLVVDVADFLVALQGLDATGAPLKVDGARGAPLSDCDEWVREWTERAGERVDGAAVLAAWEESVAAPAWDGPPVWLHADIHEGNLLARGGRVSAVIDWGGLGAGDPAVELNAAWGFLPADLGRPFQEALGLDEAAWLRGRGWALAPSISGLVYYEDTSPRMARLGRATLDRILAEVHGVRPI